jgi:hypothetical protein
MLSPGPLRTRIGPIVAVPMALALALAQCQGPSGQRKGKCPDGAPGVEKGHGTDNSTAPRLRCAFMLMCCARILDRCGDVRGPALSSPGLLTILSVHPSWWSLTLTLDLACSSRLRVARNALKVLVLT